MWAHLSSWIFDDSGLTFVLLCSEVKQLPHYSQPTHIMSLLKYIENGSVKMFWISGTK